MILLDTSILIDFYRKSNKENSHLVKLNSTYDIIFASQITFFEIYIGSNQQQKNFWDNVFNQITVLDFDFKATSSAVQIYKQLKAQNKLIETADIFIAATAIANNLSLATLNTKHFNRIENLKTVSL